MADAEEHGTEFLTAVVLETDDDEHALGHLYRPMPPLVITATDVEVVAGNIIETLGRMVECRHLVVEGQGDLAAMAHLLKETHIIGAQNLKTSLTHLHAEVEVHTVDKQFLTVAANLLPDLETDQVACRDALTDIFRAASLTGIFASHITVDDAWADDAEVVLVCIVVILLQQSLGDDGVLVEGEYPVAALIDGFLAECVQGVGNASVLIALHQQTVAVEGRQLTDGLTIVRMVVVDDHSTHHHTGECCPQVVTETTEFGLVGDDSDGILHCLRFIFEVMEERMPVL